MDKFDQNIINLIQNDTHHLTVDESVQANLVGHFNQRSLENKINQNNIVVPLLHLLSTKFMAMKIGVAAAIIVGFMGIRQFQENKPSTIHCDSTQTFYGSDTLNKELIYKDSLNW